MGSQKSTSTSTPVSAADRLASYEAGVGAITQDQNSYGGQYVAPEYQNAEYAPTADIKQLGDGDYNALEQSIVTSRTAPLERAWSLRKGDINQEMADRGLWSSGAPIQQQSKEFESSFLPQYTQAGADAATQRYNLQASDLQQLNALSKGNVDTRNALTQADAQARNAFESAQAQQKYEASWRPSDYKAGIFNQTGGVTSSSTGGGWSI